MRKRSVWVELLFGEAKQWHGLRQFRLRGLANVNMEGLLVAAGQNLKRWLVATRWGRTTGGLACSDPGARAHNENHLTSLCGAYPRPGLAFTDDRGLPED
jgi:hypothetical protein